MRRIYLKYGLLMFLPLFFSILALNLGKKLAKVKPPGRDIVELASLRPPAFSLPRRVYVNIPIFREVRVARRKEGIKEKPKKVKLPERLFLDYYLSVIKGKETYVFFGNRFYKVGETTKGGIKIKGIDHEYIYLEFMGKVYRVRY